MFKAEGKVECVPWDACGFRAQRQQQVTAKP
jgi:hypothetical protein